MRIFLSPLVVGAVLCAPLATPYALEAVAQSPVGGGSSAGAANLATDAKVSAVRAESAALRQTVSELKTELKNVTDCAAQTKVWNGTDCVSVTGAAGAAGRDGKDGKDAVIPACSAGQVVVVRNGSLACADQKLLSTTLYKCPVAQDDSQGGSMECLSHCNGQLTDQPTCAYYFDNRAGPGWACYGQKVLHCEKVQ